MQFSETPIRGLVLIDAEPVADERGFFARTWCEQEFSGQGLGTRIAQCSSSFNHRQGTLRGLHYQAAPHLEEKLVRCVQGAVFDVVVDLRADSPTWGTWFGAELSASNRRMIFVPPGCAHGFLTLVDGCEVAYQMSAPFHPHSARGVRWNDPALAIRWPEIPMRVISEQDRGWPLLDESTERHGLPLSPLEARA